MIRLSLASAAVLTVALAAPTSALQPDAADRIVASHER